jgi:uncharacterized coiled-coil protein SlyX
MKLQNLIHILIGTVCIGLLPAAQAVVPAPDGGYPNFTTAEGTKALFNLTTGSANTAVGWFSLENVSTGSFNTGVGAGTLVLNSGDQNTATGAAALLLNTTGGFNTANGALALLNNTDGSFNTATGAQALQGNISGNSNTAAGDQALLSNTTGDENTAVGLNTLRANTTGDNNTAVGSYALSGNTSGSFNVAVGRVAGINVNTANNVICIGLAGADVSDTCFIGNIRGRTTQNNNAIPVVVDTAGQLGTVSSSRRFKKQIKPMDNASEAILALKPVTFSYKSDNTNRLEFGLIAEDVAQVNPDLIVRNEKGEIYTVRYDAVNAMLLNEFLKEHRKVEGQAATISQLKSTVAEQNATIAQQQKGMEAVTARLNEQAAQIQKVSAQLAAASPSRGGLEAGKFAIGQIRGGGPAPLVVNNP